MKDNPYVSAEEIAEILNVPVTAVRYRIRVMKEKGQIRRVGSTKAGVWQIIE